MKMLFARQKAGVKTSVIFYWSVTYWSTSMFFLFFSPKQLRDVRFIQSRVETWKCCFKTRFLVNTLKLLFRFFFQKTCTRSLMSVTEHKGIWSVWASRVPPPFPPKGAMWDGARRRPSTRDDKKNHLYQIDLVTVKDVNSQSAVRTLFHLHVVDLRSHWN